MSQFATAKALDPSKSHDVVEDKLISELKDCHQEKVVTLAALDVSGGILRDEYQKLIATLSEEKARCERLTAQLKEHRKAKLRNKDLHDLKTVYSGVLEFSEEIAEISFADELYSKRIGHTPEADSMYRQRWERLQTIRVRIERLTNVLNPPSEAE